jgi:hypothetical protein
MHMVCALPHTINSMAKYKKKDFLVSEGSRCFLTEIQVVLNFSKAML